MSFCGATDTPVLDFWWHLPWFQSQGGLACMLSCLHAILQIHLWCDTCRPLDGQHGTWATLTHVLAVLRHIHKHWWHRGRSRGLGQGSNQWPTVPQHSALKKKLIRIGNNVNFSQQKFLIFRQKKTASKYVKDIWDSCKVTSKNTNRFQSQSRRKNDIKI